MLDRSAIYQINLDHRPDRWEECLRNHESMGFAAGEIQRISAHREESFGALGCARSHIKAMCEFFTNSTAEYCLILEDDFDFTMTRDEIQARLSAVEESRLAFDVLMLSGTHVLSVKCGAPYVEKVFDAQSACAYLVRRTYLQKLLPCFMNSVDKLHLYRFGSPRNIFVHLFAIDMTWKALQRQDEWYIFNPVAGVQRPSYSDIEQKHVDYSNAFRV